MDNERTPGALGSNAELGRLPTVARLYYTGQGSRRYKRASVHNGPGEALTFVSLAEERVRQAVALERDRYRTALRLAREGYASEAATGLPVLPEWRERVLALIDDALRA